MDINAKIQNLLGSPAFNMGVGLLAAGGQRRGPKIGFGQGLLEASQYANQQQSQFNELQAQRQALQSSKQRQQALSQIPSLLNTSNVPPSIAAPPGLLQQRLMGALAQAAPEQFANNLLAQQFAQPQQARPTSQMANFEFLNSLPPGQREQFANMINPPDPSQQLADTLAAQQIQANLRAQENAELEVSAQNRRRSTGARNSISEIANIVDLLESSQGTAAQPGYFASLAGTGASMQAAITNLMGGNNADAEKVAETVQKLTKGFTRLSTSTIPDAFMTSQGKLDFFSSQLPSVDLQLGTNLYLMEEYLKGIIDEDFIDDGEYNTSQGARELLERVQSLRGGQGGPQNEITEAQRQAAEMGITINGVSN